MSEESPKLSFLMEKIIRIYSMKGVGR